jgi:hypothetical protein
LASFISSSEKDVISIDFFMITFHHFQIWISFLHLLCYAAF